MISLLDIRVKPAIEVFRKFYGDMKVIFMNRELDLRKTVYELCRDEDPGNHGNNEGADLIT